MFPRLSLPALAALCPPGTDVKIIDEYFEDVDFHLPADLVGISFMTPQAPRAYQIGDGFKKLGKKVIMGGIHASALPEEALEHADAVLVGEAEGIWHKILEDLKNGRMKGIYRNAKFPELRGLPVPRYELLDKNRYRLLKINFPIQAGRGCSFKCEFCSVTKFYGGQYRFRPVDEVILELEKTRVKRLFFIDDNIASNRNYAKELFRGLIPLKVRWGGQASLNIAKDEELLNLMAQSGCRLLYIGVESISESNLVAQGKNFIKVEEIARLLKKIQKRRILIRASIIFGMDDDDPGVFHNTVNFLIKQKVAYGEFFILTPMPGTELRTKLEEGGRILDLNWSNYDGLHAVFRPLKMERETLEKGLWEAYRQFYSFPNILKRCMSFENRRLRTFLSNLYYRRMILRNRHPLYGN